MRGIRLFTISKMEGVYVKTSLKKNNKTKAVYLVDELIQVLQPAKAAVDSPFIP